MNTNIKALWIILESNQKEKIFTEILDTQIQLYYYVNNILGKQCALWQFQQQTNFMVGFTWAITLARVIFAARN